MNKLLLPLFFLTSVVFSQNFVSKNNSFKDGLSSWQFGVASFDNDAPDAEFDVVNEGQDDESSCKIKIRINTQSENFNDAYLMYKGLPIKKGKKYRVSFYIKSGRPEDKILVTVGSGTAPDIQVLVEREHKFKGDNDWKKISFTFEASKKRPTVDYGDLSLFLGFNHRFGTFYVDNFIVQQI